LAGNLSAEHVVHLVRRPPVRGDKDRPAFPKEFLAQDVVLQPPVENVGAAKDDQDFPLGVVKELLGVIDRFRPEQLEDGAEGVGALVERDALAGAGGLWQPGGGRGGEQQQGGEDKAPPP
jgi:hypothetical protein